MAVWFSCLMVTKELPQLAGHSKEILRRLSVSLIYRRNHINNTKYWKRAHQIEKYKGMACNRPHPKEGKSVVDVIEERLEGSGFVFKSAEELLIMDGDTRLARATYIGHAKRNSDYVKVVLQSVFSTVGATKIPLCGLNSEQWLQDIKVGQKFYWPENQVVKASRIKSTKKKNGGKSRKDKRVKAGEGDGVVVSDGGNVGEFEDVAVALHVMADEGKKKKKKTKRADSTTGVEGVVAGDGGNVDEGVTVAVNVAAEGKKNKKKKNKRTESTAGVAGVVAGDDVAATDVVVAAADVAATDVVVAVDDGVVTDDVVTVDDVVSDWHDDVVAYDDVVDDDVEVGDDVVVADEGKKKENKRAGSDVKGVVAGEGLGEAGKKRKKPSWEYVPIVAEVEEQLPPKRCRPQKQNEDFVTY